MLRRLTRPAWLGLGAIIMLVAIGVAAFGVGLGFESTVVSAQTEDAEAGRQVYEQHCTGCHGVEGDGAGAAADFLHPRPRDFRRGLYKVRTTGSGALPTDDDLFSIIGAGMPGTAMPGWSEILTDQERRDVAAYIKTFSRRFGRGDPPVSISIGDPIDSSESSIGTGRELFFGPLECFKCHGQEGRGDGPSALELEDDSDFTIFPADLTKNWNFRGGGTSEDIARTFLTGLLGTPMPSYEGQMSEAESWHLANFVRSLSPPEQPEVQSLFTATRVDGALPASPDSGEWSQSEDFYFPMLGQITQAPRNFTPTIDSVTGRALFDDDQIAILLTWNDRSQNVAAEGELTVDAAAVQFPAKASDDAELPNFLQGNAGNSVNLWSWRADAQAPVEVNATGLGTDRVQDAASQSLAGQAVFADGQWKLVLRRSLLTDDDSQDVQVETDRFIPIAFSAWDGQNGDDGSRRSVSAWYQLYLDSPTTVVTWLKVPAWMAVVAVIEAGILWWVWRRQRLAEAQTSE
jgi:DMSO reductase family type II enzyme heme b subunit